LIALAHTILYPEPEPQQPEPEPEPEPDLMGLLDLIMEPEPRSTWMKSTMMIRRRRRRQIATFSNYSSERVCSRL